MRGSSSRYPAAAQAHVLAERPSQTHAAKATSYTWRKNGWCVIFAASVVFVMGKQPQPHAVVLALFRVRSTQLLQRHAEALHAEALHACMLRHCMLRHCMLVLLALASMASRHATCAHVELVQHMRGGRLTSTMSLTSLRKCTTLHAQYDPKMSRYVSSSTSAARPRDFRT